MTELIISPDKEILSNIAKGKTNDLATLLKKPKYESYRDLEFLLVVLPPTSRGTQIRLRDSELKAIDRKELEPRTFKFLVQQGFIDSEGAPTLKLFEALNRSTSPLRSSPTYKQVSLFRIIESHGDKWMGALLEKEGLTSLKKGIALQKSGWFRQNGELTAKGHLFLRTQESKEIDYLYKRFTAQHISLLSLLNIHGRSLDKNLYQDVGRSKLTWEKQQELIKWFIKKGVIDGETWNPTQLGVSLRLSKSAPLNQDEFKEVDFKLEEFLSLGSRSEDKERLGLTYLDDMALQTRLYRLRASGHLDDNWKPTLNFTNACIDLRTQYSQNLDPPWIVEHRIPRLDELSAPQKTLLATLGTETSYLTQKQVLHHFELTESDLLILTRGKLLKTRREIIGAKPSECFALNNRMADRLLSGMGIEKPLRGKFQRGSHMKHDFMLFESVQAFKKMQARIGNEVVGITHERAIYQLKTSPNDNKGVTTPDLVLKLKSGDTVAFEYGNYKPSRMIEKIQNFPASEVVVFSSDTHLITQYEQLFIQSSHSETSKNVTWHYIPEVEL